MDGWIDVCMNRSAHIISEEKKNNTLDNDCSDKQRRKRKKKKEKEREREK
jgi:hypothetical protein